MHTQFLTAFQDDTKLIINIIRQNSTQIRQFFRYFFDKIRQKYAIYRQSHVE